MKVIKLLTSKLLDFAFLLSPRHKFLFSALYY